MTGARRGDALGADDRAVWDRVARTVEPLDGRFAFADPVAPLARPGPAPSVPRVRGRVPPPPMAAEPQRRVASHSDTLDGGWERRIARGRIMPDRTIDLHGLTLDQAWRRLDFALEDAAGSGIRTLLVITGRAAADPGAGRASPIAPRPRGMIRAKLEDWIAASRHARVVASLRTAHPRHGGAGAVYLILRRTRA